MRLVKPHGLHVEGTELQWLILLQVAETLEEAGHHKEEVVQLENTKEANHLNG